MSLAASGIRVKLAGRIVLDGISLTCGAGRITALVGPNGAGKSTLVRALAGLLPVEAGSVTLEGRELSALPTRDRGRRIAYLPQQRLVHWPLAVRHVVALGRLPHGESAASAAGRRATEAAMATMDVVHLADRPVSEVSGGELARVLFARALAQEAPVILADEPTAGLDPAHALGLFEALVGLAAGGRTIVVALHDLSLAARFCHEVVMLAEGGIAVAGPSSEVLTPSALGPVFGARMAVGTVGGVPSVVAVSPLT